MRHERNDNLMTKAQVLNALSGHIGAVNGVTARQLVIEITGRASSHHERRLRYCVEQLRDEGIAICADPANGYHIAANSAELQASIKFLTDRITTAARQLRSLRRIARPSLHGQRRLAL